MTEYADRFPMNARVSVDYKTGRVSFGYLGNKKKWVSWTVDFIYPSVLFIWIFANLGIYLGVLLIRTLQTPLLSDGGAVNWGEMYLQAVIIAVFIGYFFGIPMFVSLVIGRYYHKFMKIWPRLQARIARLSGQSKYRAIVTKLDKTIYEIPMFKNVLLDYKAEGDFAKQLKKIEIVEHPFKIIRKEKGKEVEKPNQSLWKAIFKFTKIPKDGKLVVNFI